MKKLKILSKMLPKSKKSPKNDPNGSKSHGNLPITSTIDSSSLMKPQVFNETCFSENMSDNVPTNSQDLEITLNPAMRQATTNAANTAAIARNPPDSPLRASLLENMESQDPWPNSNNPIEVEDDTRSQNSTVQPRYSRTAASKTASSSNLVDLFGLGPARRNNTSLENRDTFSIGEKGPVTSGKGRTSTAKRTVKPYSYLSSASSASLNSDLVDVPYENPWHKDFYESLAKMNSRHTELIEQQLAHNTGTSRLAREVDEVNTNMRQMLISQKSTDERLATYDNMQKRCTERVERVERHLQHVDSNVSDLRKEIQIQSRDTIAHQRELSLSMDALTKEIKIIQANQRIPVKRYKPHSPSRLPSPPTNWQPRKDPPKPPTDNKPSTSLQTQLQAEFSVDNKGAAKKAPSRSVAIDPMSFQSSFDDSDTGDDTTTYHTARSRTQTGFETAENSTRSRYRQPERQPVTQPDRPTATSTRKRDRHQAEIQTPSPDSDVPDVSPIPAAVAPTPLSPDDQKDRRFAEALSQAMAKGLKP